MSKVEELLSQALKDASVLGEIALALAARRYRPGSPEQWARSLRAAANHLDKLSATKAGE